MEYSDFKFTAKDGQEVFVCKWSPKDGKAKAAIQIAHGLVEHIARYERFAAELVKSGYIVYGNDHRGHGKTAEVLENVGYYADHDGFNKVVEDMHTLTGIIKKENPGIPFFLFGHSMGSLLSRSYITRFGTELNGVILSGTGGKPGLLGSVGLMMAKMVRLTKGKKHPSKLMDNLAFGQFNNAFKPNRTDFDWLSRDEAEVDKYVADPYCGVVSTAGLWVDLLSGVIDISKPANIARIPKSLPMYIFSGDRDPVGNDGKGVKQAYEMYLNAGIKDIELKLYKDGRHEMLNEINRDEVMQDVINWLDTRMPAA